MQLIGEVLDGERHFRGIICLSETTKSYSEGIFGQSRLAVRTLRGSLLGGWGLRRLTVVKSVERADASLASPGRPRTA